jgi:hypothetical protein
MKKILIIACSLLLITSAQASGTGAKKDKGDMDLKLDIHLSKDGDLTVKAKGVNAKEIEDWVNRHTKDVKIQLEDADGRKEKNMEISLTIKEK